MKKLLVTLAVTVTCFGAFAQGKIAFVNDSLHMVFFTNNLGRIKAADAADAGLATPVSITSGAVLIADLYGGTSSGALSLYASQTVGGGGAPGRFNQVSVTANVPPIPGGTTAFFQVQIRETVDATALASQAAGRYFGFSAIFTTVASSTIAFNSIINHGNAAFSTWGDGTTALGGGNQGAVIVQADIPEPGTFALVGLGAAALLIFRRRK